MSTATKLNTKHMFDLIVLGGGSGGVRCARISAGHGARVALVESSLKHGPPTYTAIGGTVRFPPQNPHSPQTLTQ